MLGDAHAEGLVLDGVRIGGDLRLEDVRRRRAVDRTAPAAVRHPGQDQLLLHASERDPHSTAHPQRSAAEVGDQVRQLLVGEGLRGGGGHPWRPVIVEWLDDQGAGALSSEERDQLDGVVGIHLEIAGDDPTRLALGQEAVEERSHGALGEPFGTDGQRQREQRRAEAVESDRLWGVGQAGTTSILIDRGDQRAGEPDAEVLLPHHSASSMVIRTPSSRSTRRIRRTCSVSFPLSRFDR